MPVRLPAVLSSRDLPGPELGALILDGEAYRLDDCAVPVDQVAGPAVRAAVLAAALPDRLIVEQHSAAWVWGALDKPPTRHEVCADIQARARPPLDARLTVREVVILPEDIAIVSGVSVTTPLRTAIDLARFVEEWNPDEARVLTELLRLAHCTVLDCARAMNRRRNLPNKRIALERLTDCCAPVA